VSLRYYLTNPMHTKTAKDFDEFFDTVNAAASAQVSGCIVAGVTRPGTRHPPPSSLNIRQYVTSQVVKTPQRAASSALGRSPNG
jgi:hypothetical protein